MFPLVMQVNPMCLKDISSCSVADTLVYMTSTFQIVFTPGQQDKCFLCGQVGHLAANCEGKVKRKVGEFDEKGDSVVSKKPFQVRIPSLKSCAD